MTSSFEPELNYQATKPRFNGNPATLFEGGTVPGGWQTMNSASASGTPVTGVVVTLAVNEAGNALTNGFSAAVATSKISGAGDDALTVDVTVTAGQVQSVVVADGGTGYAAGDVVSLVGFADVELGVSLVS